MLNIRFLSNLFFYKKKNGRFNLVVVCRYKSVNCYEPIIIFFVNNILIHDNMQNI